MHFAADTAGASGKPGEGDTSAKTSNAGVMEPRPIGYIRGLASPATPVSGTFVFPLRSTRSRSSSLGRRSTTAGEVAVPFDGLSIKSDDTDELCSLNLLHDAYPSSDAIAAGVFERRRNDSISPRSQNSAYFEVPKLQLDCVDR